MAKSWFFLTLKILDHQFSFKDRKSVSSWISNESHLTDGQLDRRWWEKYQKIGSKSLAKQGIQGLRNVRNVSYKLHNEARHFWMIFKHFEVRWHCWWAAAPTAAASNECKLESKDFLTFFISKLFFSLRTQSSCYCCCCFYCNKVRPEITFSCFLILESTVRTTAICRV